MHISAFFLLALALSWLPFYIYNKFRPFASTGVLRIEATALGQVTVEENNGVVCNGINRLATATPKIRNFWSNLWFKMGVVVAVTGAIVCLAFLLVNVFLTVRHYLARFLATSLPELGLEAETIQQWQSYTPKVVMMLPGVNIPLNHILYLIAALLVSAVVHEAGHGIAASSEGLRIDSVGFMLFWGIPAAYVGLPIEITRMRPVMRQLKIFCAVPWLLLVPAESVHNGAVVYDVHRESPIYGHFSALGGRKSFVLTRVNDCAVTSATTWKSCLLSLASSPNRGHCVKQHKLDAFLKSESAARIDHGTCCTSNSDASRVCFALERDSETTRRYCLPARQMLADWTTTRCSSRKFSTEKDALRCAWDEESCALPLDTYNEEQKRVPARRGADYTQLIQLSYEGQDKQIIYYGTPASLYSEVQLTTQIARFPSIFPLWLIEHLDLLCHYTIVLSSALAAFNVLPVKSLDGEHIFNCLCQAASAAAKPEHKATIELWFGRLRRSATVLFISNMIIAVINMLLAVIVK